MSHLMVEAQVGFQVPAPLFMKHVHASCTNSGVPAWCTGISACLGRHDRVNGNYGLCFCFCVSVCLCIGVHIKFMFMHTGLGYHSFHYQEKIISSHSSKFGDAIDDIIPASMSPDIDRRSRVS